MDNELSAIGLDPEWISANTLVEQRTPERAEFAGFIGTGQMSRNARFNLDWGDAEGPKSVVVKIPSNDEGTRAVSFEHNVYRKECKFYADISPLVDVVTPAALAVHFDDTAMDFAIVLEDLSNSEQGDQFTEPTAAQLDLAIDQAAALHAPVWNNTTAPALTFLHEAAAGQADSAAQMIPAFVPMVLDRLGAGLDEGIVAMLERFSKLVGPWGELASKPTTLVHGDFRPDNFMFGVNDSAAPIAIVDWQTLNLGRGVTDIAYLLGAAIDPERRRKIERGALERYIDQLSQRGVEYDMEHCLTDYAIGSVHGLLVAVTATVMAEQTERGDALFTLMINRHGRHALDYEILDRLDRLS